MTEQVLVLPRAEVPGGCDFTGVRPATGDLLVQLRAAVERHGRYMDRPIAEESPHWKQLIPYVVVRHADDTFLMERTTAGGDPRLHRKASIGVGGHLNPVDHGDDPLMSGLAREWAEEVDAPWSPAFELVGLLNDDSNPVGAVHLGVVFGVEAQGPIEVRETEKLTGRMATRTEVLDAWPRLETWSQLVAAELLGLAEGTRTG
jgi:predicted NUDIX family phosphoesterase